MPAVVSPADLAQWAVALAGASNTGGSRVVASFLVPSQANPDCLFLFLPTTRFLGTQKCFCHSLVRMCQNSPGPPLSFPGQAQA